MNTPIPDGATVGDRLKPMTYAQLTRLSELSGVPFHTLLKMRDGDTQNPRINTVAKLWPHITEARGEAA